MFSNGLITGTQHIFIHKRKEIGISLNIVKYLHERIVV